MGDGDLAGSDPSNGEEAGATEDTVESADPVFAELLSCRSTLDQEENKQLELDKLFETCGRKRDQLKTRIETATESTKRREGLVTKVAEEAAKAVADEKSALDLMEKERTMKETVGETCAKQVDNLNVTHAKAIAQAQKAASDHMAKIQDMDAQMQLKAETDEAQAVSDATTQADAQVQAALQQSTAAVADAEKQEATAAA